MKQTQKYKQASQILTYPHNTQDELYTELNRLGWYWNASKKQWERDETPALEASKLIKIRVLAPTNKVAEVAQHITEAFGDIGLSLVEQSAPYPCRPLNQNESRIYLSFQETPVT